MITTYKGDCLEEMKKIADGSVDMILTDLPYGVTINKVDVLIPFGPLWEQFDRVIKENGAVVLFGQGLFYVDLVNSNRKFFRYDLVWQKLFPTGFLNANKMPLRDHEQIAVFYKKLPTYNAQKFEGEESYPETSQRPNDQNYGKPAVKTERTIGANERMPRSVLKFEDLEAEEQVPEPSHEQIAVFYKKLPTYNPQLQKSDTEYKANRKDYADKNYREFDSTIAERTIPGNERFPRTVLSFQRRHPSITEHPTEKPVPLLEWLVKTYTNQGETVLDATMGSGSTGLACQNTDRSFVGIEKDDTHYATALRRLNDNQARLDSEKPGEEEGLK